MKVKLSNQSYDSWFDSVKHLEGKEMLDAILNRYRTSERKIRSSERHLIARLNEAVLTMDLKDAIKSVFIGIGGPQTNIL